jgi:hypothetical protein
MASLRSKIPRRERGARISPGLDFGDIVDDDSSMFAGQCLVVVVVAGIA